MKTPYIRLAIFRKTLRIFIRGMIEFRSDCGLTWFGNPSHPYSRAYDSGRDFAHKLTLRKFDY